MNNTSNITKEDKLEDRKAKKSINDLIRRARRKGALIEENKNN